MSRDPVKPVGDRTIADKQKETTNARLYDMKERVAEVEAKTKDRAGQVAVADTVSEGLGEERFTSTS